jgi:hypothetical protein
MSRPLLVALLFAMSSGSHAASPKVTGVFSNMRFGTEDVTGVEVFVTYSDKGHFAQVQCAEGAISRPIVVPVLVAGSHVEFSVPTDSAANKFSCPAGKFKGEVSAKGLRGQFEGTDWPGFLKRSKSYWQ